MENTHALDLGAQVRATRRARGLSSKRLAELAGVARNTLGRIENGEHVMPGNLRAVLDALSISPLVESNDYPAQIQLVGMFVQQWLSAVPEPERNHQIERLMRFCATGSAERTTNARSARAQLAAPSEDRNG